LIFAGHSPGQAEAHVNGLAAWTDAPPSGVEAFARALFRMWTRIADTEPTPWKQQMAESARAWHSHRVGR
jgi:hypothetical protein